MKIRNAGLEDIEALIGLLEELFTVEADFEFEEETQRRGLKILLDGCGKHRCVRVAESKNLIVGMATVQTLISTAEGGVAGLVEDVVVREDRRGEGIGSQLLRSIEDWAEKRGVCRLQLLADKNNSTAIEFYKNHQWDHTELICLRKIP